MKRFFISLLLLLTPLALIRGKGRLSDEYLEGYEYLKKLCDSWDIVLKNVDDIIKKNDLSNNIYNNYEEKAIKKIVSARKSLVSLQKLHDYIHEIKLK